ncbi:MAG: alpha/beta hydrolase fold domain-containing protein [Acidobacteria bacterium]|nr:alpha/beta hydrolase fold domain-containing protein [Acidobacteriota bacterium]
MRTCLLSLVFAGALLAQAPPPDDILFEEGVEYSAVGGKQLLDIARPKTGQGPFPAVVCIHGGGFRAGSRQSFRPIVYYLAQHGYVAATIDYRLSPMNQFPAAVEDSKAAVRFLRANAARFDLDPDRIGATGGSAGGHLVLMLGVTGGVEDFEGSGPNQQVSSRVQAVVNQYGPTDLVASYEPGGSVDAAEVLPMFLGGDLETAMALTRRASPLNWVSPDDAPTLTLHGEKDNYVAFEHAGWITDRLKQAGVPAKLISFPNAMHGFKDPADKERAWAAMVDWFDQYLAPAPKQTLLLVADHGPSGQIVAMDWPSARERWTLPNNRGHDVQILPNGHVLYTTGNWKRVVEADADGEEVWSYGAAEGLEHPVAAQRLPDGHTLIGDMVLGKVFEIDKAGKTVWEYKNPELGDRQMRSARRTPAGTTLIAVERLNKVIEVDKAGKVVWEFRATGGEQRFPYQAWRLENGHTLIGMAAPGQIVEVDKAGKIVRSVGGADGDLRMGWCSGLQPLPGGGFLVSDYTGRRLLEFDGQWKVKNEWRTGKRTVASVSMLR